MVFSIPKALLVAATVLAVCYAQNIETAENQDDASYAFAYSVNSPANGDVKSHSESRKGMTVTGEYKVTQPDGCVRHVRYVAGKMGFQPEVRYLGNCNPDNYLAPAAAPAKSGPINIEYSAPVQTYSAPAKTYSAPATSYSAPTTSYSAPAMTYSAPAMTYSTPEKMITTHSAPEAPAAPAAPAYYSAPAVKIVPAPIPAEAPEILAAPAKAAPATTNYYSAPAAPAAFLEKENPPMAYAQVTSSFTAPVNTYSAPAPTYDAPAIVEAVRRLPALPQNTPRSY